MLLKRVPQLTLTPDNQGGLLTDPERKRIKGNEQKKPDIPAFSFVAFKGSSSVRSFFDAALFSR